MLRPADPDGMRAAWEALEQTWAATIDRAERLTEAQRHESVDGEWSFVETLRHLVFAMDKWFTAPILGDERSTRSACPTRDRSTSAGPASTAAPTRRSTRCSRCAPSAPPGSVTASTQSTPADLTREVEVLENGTVPVHDCVYTVFEEEFEHNRYALRDLAHFD